MSLNEPTQENLEVIINEMATMLQVVNRSIMDPEDYDIEKYDELKSLYDMLKQKGQLSVAETQAFVQELADKRIKKG
ncbi:DUF1128 domain-containing protein [Aquibacillus koreensis]|uniref:DUF1128 domain-containing protein n=1 Tax=Aquibacillus koreensis TaxID=279446 RepID=A0A9X4AJL1_9BACI|nr:DUF1128 domain-containing protein [Aquibacillus koreensis]MCT2534492.1 DUF1128 domain-containing protein [Aquibacillus koreensis]MDC3421914.1 DUF1128 domain-containing protein [Aquibacillus koreensis]